MLLSPLVSTADREKWSGIYRARGEEMAGPSSLIAALAAELPTSGRALDVAGGSGRHAIWLARRGLDVTIADISEAGLSLASRRAARHGVTIQTVCVDLETCDLPAGPWDLILCVHYLDRSLFPEFRALLVDGGMLVVLHPTRSNLQRHDRPSARYLLEDGELPALIQGLNIIRYDEGWLDEGRHEARAVARRIVQARDRSL